MSIIRRPWTTSGIKDIFFLISVFLCFSLLLYLRHLHLHPSSYCSETSLPSPLTLDHLLFSISSSNATLASRLGYIRLWYEPISQHNTTFLFLDNPVKNLYTSTASVPPILIPGNFSSFPFGHRIAHTVKDAFTLNISNIYWYIFGDDDTVFFTENLVRILSKYDHNKWYYIGYCSESYRQNAKLYFDMAYGGGGFAISAPLVQALSQVLDSCLQRYLHLTGSDTRVFSCLSELGVGLTAEHGFHQVDVRGDLSGILSAHPLSLLASLHHLDSVEPIFPGMSRIHSLQHLFKAVNIDPERTLQQTVCYDRTNTLTVSVAWGYAVQVYEENHLLPEIISPQRTFKPWNRRLNASTTRYMFKTRDLPIDPCKRPIVFYLYSVVSEGTLVRTNYRKHVNGDCVRRKAVQKLRYIGVFSPKPSFHIKQMEISRRHCCEISPSADETMTIHIRKCGRDEVIAMQE